MSTLPKWTEEREETLVNLVGSNNGTEVSTASVAEAAEKLSTTTRSVAAKLRKMGYPVESASQEKVSAFSESETNELADFVNANPNLYTYAEIAASVSGGKFTSKQVQGKLLSLELTSLVKATPKVEKPKTYTDDEESKLRKLLAKNLFIEDIADKMGRSVQSIRGKILSMSRTDDSITIPKQKEYKEKGANNDPLVALGDVTGMTVEEIAEKIGKTERGVKTMLTHRGIKCKNYDGEKRNAKNEAARAAS